MMVETSGSAWSEFSRMIGWIALVAVAMVAASLWYLSLYTPLYLSVVLATVGGVFLSVLLGCGLFAAAFFSDKSGHDRNVSDATRRDSDPRD
jgi:glucan phosphoethanolaminetransferase (alkaline phosphatase superfamily)